MVDEIASDYLNAVSFLAVAGHAGLDRTAARASELFSANISWGSDESIWELYSVFGTPTTVLITGDNRIVDVWFGALEEEEIRSRLDWLVALSR